MFQDFLRQNNTGKLLWQLFGIEAAKLCLFGIPEHEEIMWNAFKLAGIFQCSWFFQKFKLMRLGYGTSWISVWLRSCSQKHSALFRETQQKDTELSGLNVLNIKQHEYFLLIWSWWMADFSRYYICKLELNLEFLPS